MTSFSEWLGQIGLAHYGPVLAENGIDFDVAPSLTEDDLHSLGLNLGDRRRWLQAITRLGAQPGAPDTAGVLDTATKSSAATSGERRQLTVMFCDLVGSTALAERLDPEEVRELMQAYRKACSDIVARYEGHVAQYLGDGLMVYFGWPGAHEDDAERGVRSALEIVQAVKGVSAAQPLAVRIGVATGAVVVGEASREDNAEAKLAVGETPNLAARLQGLAGPDEIVIAPATRRLLGDAFELTELRACILKGIAEPVHLFRVVRARATESRFEAAHGGVALTPLVGREEEVALLLRRWRQAHDGEGQVVLISGEPGIGKSRLTQALREQIAGERYIGLRHQCSPYHLNSALYPLIEQFEFAARFTREDTSEQRLDKMEAVLAGSQEQRAESAPLIAALLSLPTERYPPLKLSPQKQKEKTLDALAGQVEALARTEPVLMVFEDTHWIDPTSQESLDVLVPRLQALPILLVITYRTEYTPHWAEQAHVTTLGLSRLGRRQGAELVAKVTGGKALPQEVLEQIVAHTDGVPLFVEELTKSVLESGLLREAGGQYTLQAPLPALAIPTSLRDSLLARLDRLAPIREVAQIGACIGREFSYELLACISTLRTEQLEEALKKLTEVGLVYRRGTPPDSTYTFKHALVQDAAYDSLLKSKRQQLHAQIVQVLEKDFSERVADEPELLAHHYTQAGLLAEAIPYWQRAGQRAVERSANAEAISHLTEGLKLLKTLLDTPERARRELELQTTLGPALIATKGFASPEVEQAYGRARELCQQVGETPQLFPVLWASWAFCLVREDSQTACGLAEQLLRLARSVQDPALLLMAHRALGTTFHFLGEFALAQEHAEQGISLYDPQQHRSLALLYAEHPGVVCYCFAAHILWYRGYPDQALKHIQDALALAQALAHPFSLVHALDFAAWLHQYRREGRLTQERAETDLTLATEQGIAFFLTHGTILRGWALVEQDQREEGVAQIRQGLAAYRATGAELERPYWLALLTEAYGKLGQTEEALSTLEEALLETNKHGWRFCEAELYRLKGEVLLARSAAQHAEAETCFRQALDIARRQQAKSLELRAAMSLSRLWQRQRKGKEAHDLLAPIYGWFSEGFDTADLQDASALLEALA